MVHHCKVRHCDEPRQIMKSGSTGERVESRYCRGHACHGTNPLYPQFFVPCENVAKPGSRYCVSHPKCRIPDCYNPRRFEDDRMGRYFCDQHTCLIPRCGTPATGHDRRCEVHKTCGHVGCDNPRARAPDGRGFLPVCPQHIIRRCHIKGCGHEVVARTSFCTFHKCMITPCGGQKATDQNYCDAHVCGIEGCHQPISHPTKIHHEGRGCFYCQFHECKDEGCHRQAAVEHGYCSAHGCGVARCGNARAKDPAAGIYCMSHYGESLRRSAEQIGRDKERAAALERRRQEEEEHRERVRQARIEARRKEELAKLVEERNAAMELAKEAEKKAQRLQRMEERRREIEELEREKERAELVRERARRRQSFSTATSSTVADHPILDVYRAPAFSNGYANRHLLENDFVYETGEDPWSDEEITDSSSEDASIYDGDYHPGVRHVRVSYHGR